MRYTKNVGTSFRHYLFTAMANLYALLWLSKEQQDMLYVLHNFSFEFAARILKALKVSSFSLENR